MIVSVYQVFGHHLFHLASQSGNKSKFNEKIDAFVPDKSKQQENTIGSANGIFTLEETIKDAFDKGFDVSNKITKKNNEVSVPTVVEKKSTDHDKFWSFTKRQIL